MIYIIKKGCHSSRMVPLFYKETTLQDNQKGSYYITLPHNTSG